jgi:hypothetical protein
MSRLEKDGISPASQNARLTVLSGRSHAGKLRLYLDAQEAWLGRCDLHHKDDLKYRLSGIVAGKIRLIAHGGKLGYLQGMRLLLNTLHETLAP